MRLHLMFIFIGHCSEEFIKRAKDESQNDLHINRPIKACFHYPQMYLLISLALCIHNDQFTRLLRFILTTGP